MAPARATPSDTAWKSPIGIGRRLFKCAAIAFSTITFFSGCPGFGPAPNGGPIGLQLIAEGLTSPLKLVAAPDGSGRLFIVDQIGLVRVIDVNGALSPVPFLDVRDRMVALGGFDERGLLGLAFHPNYSVNGRFFVFYSAPKGGDIPAEFDCESHVSRFVVSANPLVADPTSEQVILRFGKPQSNHNAGDLAFGPDNFLYISTGDGGSGSDVGIGHTPGLGNGQDKTNLLGKILRIDVDSASPYAIPPSNPFVAEAGARGEIFAYGLRNPFRFAFDPGGARRLFVGDVGQGIYEEVDIVTLGGNYGWHVREGLHCFDPANSSAPPAVCATAGADGQPFVNPILEYTHDGSGDTPRGVSVIGGCVYRGTTLPSYTGQYIFGDFSRGFLGPDASLFAATEAADGTWSFRELSIAGSANGRLGRFIMGFGQDASGEVYICTSTGAGPSGTAGQVHRLVPP